MKFFKLSTDEKRERSRRELRNAELVYTKFCEWILTNGEFLAGHYYY